MESFRPGPDRLEHAWFRRFDWVAAKVLGPVGMQPWGNVRISESRRQPARWLRKEFTVEKKIKRATVSFSGLGWSELYLNGGKVGDRGSLPGVRPIQQARVLCHLRCHKTTAARRKRDGRGARQRPLLRRPQQGLHGDGKVLAGPNCCCNFASNTPTVRCRTSSATASWKLTTNGPIVANNDYDGEEYDARKEFPGWSQPGFDDSNWQPAQIVEAPPGVVAAQMIEPIRVTGTLKPVAMTEPKPGVSFSTWAKTWSVGPAAGFRSGGHAGYIALRRNPQAGWHALRGEPARCAGHRHLHPQGPRNRSLGTALHFAWIPLRRSDRLSRQAGPGFH